MVHVTIVKVGDVNTTRECFDAEVIVRSRWREPLLDHTEQVVDHMIARSICIDRTVCCDRK